MTSPVFQHRLTHHLLDRRRALLATHQGTHQQGFTLVELLIVVVILGVLGAVGIPAYLNQVRIARINAGNQGAMAAAKACTALRVTNETSSFELPSGVTGTCLASGAATFTSSIVNLGTQAIATVSGGGAVTLSTPAN